MRCSFTDCNKEANVNFYITLFGKPRYFYCEGCWEVIKQTKELFR